MGKHYFKTAEFAQLCGVKKDTLLHYDHIGLLKPERVGENGYRYYSVGQLATYDLIAALRRLDTPLREIRDYVARRSPEALLTLVEEKRAVLEEEQRRLDRMAALLRTTRESMELALSVTPGLIRLEELPAARCAVMPAPVFGAGFEQNVFLLHIRDFLSWARAHGSASLSTGDIVSRESLAEDRFIEDYYYCSLPQDAEGWEVRVRPAGTYAVLYHQGPYESEAEAVRRLRDWVLAQGHTIDVDLYEEDLVNDTSCADPARYLLKLSLKIRPKKAETDEKDH